MTPLPTLTPQEQLARAQVAHAYSAANEIDPADAQRTAILAQAVKDCERKVVAEEGKK